MCWDILLAQECLYYPDLVYPFFVKICNIRKFNFFFKKNIFFLTLVVLSCDDLLSVPVSLLSGSTRSSLKAPTDFGFLQSYLFFLFDCNDLQVKSAPAPVQVFPPLRIEPRNITLLIGAAFQVLHETFFINLFSF